MASRGLPFLKASIDVHNAICAIVLYIGFVRSLGLGGGRQGHINQALSTDKVYFDLPDYSHIALNLVRDSQRAEGSGIFVFFSLLLLTRFLILLKLSVRHDY